MPLIRTESLELRPLRAEDEAEFVRVHELSREHFQRWMPALEPGMTMRSLFAASLRRARRGIRDGDEVRLVGLLQDGRMAGLFVLNRIVRQALQNAHASWRVSVDLAGRGLATEAVIALLDLAFAPAPLGLGLHRVQAEILPQNRASVRVAEKAGFRIEGEARAYLQVNGVWQDHLLLAKTVDEHQLRYLRNGRGSAGP
jgi:ribosomal-protein-alanine N-acetyltransferase